MLRLSSVVIVLARVWVMLLSFFSVCSAGVCPFEQGEVKKEEGR